MEPLVRAGAMGRLAGVWALAAHDLRRRTRSIIIWGVALGALGALYVALFPSMGNLLQQYMNEAPEQMRQFTQTMGGGAITIEQWLDMELFSGIMPLALPFFMMVVGARTVAGREERKMLDLLMSNPLPRWQLILGSLLTMAGALAGVLAIVWVLTYIAVPFAGVGLAPGRLAAGLVSLWPFCLFFGALAMLLSAFVRRGAIAIAVPAVVLVIMYVLDALGQVSKTMEPLQVLSLQHHLGRPLSGSFPWTVFLLMLAAVCVLSAGAVAVFRRRDIYT